MRILKKVMQPRSEQATFAMIFDLKHQTAIAIIEFPCIFDITLKNHFRFNTGKVVISSELPNLPNHQIKETGDWVQKLTDETSPHWN